MRCRKVKEKLGRFLAGECRSSEFSAIEKHLSHCPGCAAELNELQRLDLLLDQWEPEPAPPDFWNSVMTRVAEESVNLHGNNRRMGYSKRPVLLLRDLAVATAVSLALFWNAGPWFSGSQVLVAGKSVNGAVVTYTRVTDTALTRLTETAGAYTQKIIFEEWKLR
ncbi:anti-sigma factor [Desulfotruncus arcticus]|nr:zf-HC2 domain-containing protein [Desulfotruncus arcticus]